jgi:hypothetical protein
MRKREDDRLIGVWRHPVAGWEIKYQQGGKKISEYRKDEREARLRADYWKAALERPQDSSPSANSEEHIVHYWDRKLRQIAELLLASPGDREMASACRSIASAAQAAMRAAKYIPAPISCSPDAPAKAADLSSMTTEEIKSALGDG